MPELLSEKTVTARKPHGCMTCNTTAIQPGAKYHRETYVNDGRVYDWVTCVGCAEITSLVFEWSGNEDGIGADDYAEWANEFQDDPDAGELARAHLARLRPTKEEQ